jgi:hypothetical protein
MGEGGAGAHARDHLRRDRPPGHPTPRSAHAAACVPLNEAHLAAFVTAVTGAALADCEGYLEEIKDYSVLAEHVRRKVLDGAYKGLGSCVLAAAILRNRQEGNDGRYCGTDIEPSRTPA